MLTAMVPMQAIYAIYHDCDPMISHVFRILDVRSEKTSGHRKRTPSRTKKSNADSETFSRSPETDAEAIALCF